MLILFWYRNLLKGLFSPPTPPHQAKANIILPTLTATFVFGVVLLPPLGQEGGDVTMAPVPEVLHGQGDPSAGEEMTQTVTAGEKERIRSGRLHQHVSYVSDKDPVWIVNHREPGASSPGQNQILDQFYFYSSLHNRTVSRCFTETEPRPPPR